MMVKIVAYNRREALKICVTLNEQQCIFARCLDFLRANLAQTQPINTYYAVVDYLC